MTGSRTQVRIAQAMQQMIDTGQRTEHAEFRGENPLDIDAAQRTDLILGRRSCFHPLTDLFLLLGRQWQSRLSTTTILQAFQPPFVIAIHPALADPSRQTER